jgi:tripartite-type tricarboxylate transporter receptor subunit TctC
LKLPIFRLDANRHPKERLMKLCLSWARMPFRPPAVVRTLIAAGVMLGPAASAQTYPDQLIKVVVAATPGTSMDSIARIIGPKLSQRLGQAVMVENRAGASGTIGTGQVAKAAPDGHTLMVGAQSMVVVPHMYRAVTYNALTDFVPVSMLAYGTLVLVTHPKSGIGSVAEMIAMAKANPEKLTYASPGIGLPQHLAMELIKDAAGIKMLHIPYKGSAGALTDLMGGQVFVSMVPIQVALPHVRSGKLKPLAVVRSQRHAKVPEVPTLQESGIPGVDIVAGLSNFLVAPKGTPASIVSRLNDELRAIMQMPDVKERLESDGLDVATSSPAELQSMLERASASSAQIIRKNNISLD